MPWWGWIALGALLLGAELMVIDAQFFLVFIGLSALVIGLADLAGLAVPAWAEFLLFALLALGSMLLFRQKIYGVVRGNAKGTESNPAGDSVHVDTDLPAGAETRLEYRGSSWTAVNSGESTIVAGSKATIDAVTGTVLKISNKT